RERPRIRSAIRRSLFTSRCSLPLVATATRRASPFQSRTSSLMKENVKRVFYVRRVAHPCFLDIIAQRPEIRLDKLENETPDSIVEPILAAAHAYQIGAARDELPVKFH